MDSPLDHRAAPLTGRLLTQPPTSALARFIDHYWLCTDNSDRAHLVLPDGCIDLVLELGHGTWQGFGYGSTTQPARVPCVPGRHYLGIRFRPAQSRHFLAASAAELTDRREDARHLLRGHMLAQWAEQACMQTDHAGMLAAFERGLLAMLPQPAPEPPSAAELMVRHIEAARGALRIEALARHLGKSPRQLQRLFLEQVGVSAKFFACIVRVQRARALIASCAQADLAGIAAETGYADQSHMTRDFARLTGCSPTGQPHVAFLQDDHRLAFAH